MNRLVWLLLLVLGTAFVQVQPVTFAAEAQHKCGCCGGKGSCRMPDCLPPATAPGLCTLGQPASTAATESRRVALPPRQVPVHFFAALAVPAAVSAAVRPSEHLAVAARVPLFTTHCSWLI